MLILISAVTVALFIWRYIAPTSAIAIATPIATPTAAAAALLALLGSVAYGRTPEQYIAKLAPVIYSVAIVLCLALIAGSGGLQSPLIGVWIMVAIFAGLFGWWGIGGLLILSNVLLSIGVFTSAIGRVDILASILLIELPVIVSYMLWHGTSALFQANDKDEPHLSRSLKSEAAKSNTIIQSISDGVIMTKPSGEITLINPAAQHMTGWNLDDALQLHIGSVLRLETEAGQPLTEGNHPVMQTLNNKTASQSTAILTTKSDKRITAALSITPLDSGGVIVVFRDITKERAEEREQAEFISTASHEMRTPVASIEGFLALALNPKVARIDVKAYEYISKAHDSAKYLGRLLKDLLEISRAEDGRLQNTMVVVEAVELARTITESLLPKAQQKGLELIYKPAGKKAITGSTTIAPVFYIRADKDRLRESLSNLIENAIKYTPAGKVIIDVQATDKQVQFSVKDSGIGIPAEDLPHLFQKFYRVNNSDTREIGGTGLGLYLSRRLIESMNGHIRAESEYHKGSTFFIELPRIHRQRAMSLLEAQTQQETTATAATQQEQQSAPQTVLKTEAKTPPPQEQPQIPQEETITPPQALPTQPTHIQTPAPPPPPTAITPPISQPQPTTIPQTQPEQTQQTQPAPQVTTPRATTPSVSNRPNIPISALERNPEAYLSRRRPSLRR